jgi:tetrahydromethanopterin S-methyltransferase subunit B
MNYYQTYYFTEEEIEQVNNNLMIINEKVKQLDNKLNDKSKSLSTIENDRISKSINRLNMSKKCIKYYYNI